MQVPSLILRNQKSMQSNDLVGIAFEDTSLHNISLCLLKFSTELTFQQGGIFFKNLLIKSIHYCTNTLEYRWNLLTYSDSQSAIKSAGNVFSTSYNGISLVLALLICSQVPWYEALHFRHVKGHRYSDYLAVV